MCVNIDLDFAVIFNKDTIHFIFITVIMLFFLSVPRDPSAITAELKNGV